MTYQTATLIAKLIIISLFGVPFCIPHPIFAQEIDFSLYPALVEVTATKSASIDIPLLLTNHTDNTQHLTFSFKPFTRIDDNGYIVFSKNDTLVSNEFISVLKNFEKQELATTVRPQEQASLTLTIDIPKLQARAPNQQELYFTTLFTSKTNHELPFSGSYVTGSIGTNILLRIITEKESQTYPKAELKEFSVVSDTILLNLQEVKPVVFIENQGDHYFKASGEITLYDGENKEIGTFVMPQQYILPNMSRDIASIAEEKDKPQISFGKYRAVAKVTIDGKELTQSQTFYVVQKKILALIGGILLVIMLFIRRLSAYQTNRKKLRQSRKKGTK